MEIALLILLFLVGTVVSAMQAMKYLDRRQGRKKDGAKSTKDKTD